MLHCSLRGCSPDCAEGRLEGSGDTCAEDTGEAPIEIAPELMPVGSKYWEYCDPESPLNSGTSLVQ